MEVGVSAHTTLPTLPSLTTSALSAWIEARGTPILWIVGMPGSGKTAAVRALLAARPTTDDGDVVEVSLSEASPDRCLSRVLAASGRRAPARANTRRLFERLSGVSLLVLDAVDTIQDSEARGGAVITDLRFERLLDAIARARWPAMATIVTSRCPPPSSLPRDAITLLEVAREPSIPTMRIDPPAAGPPSVLEALASSREATSGWLLGIVCQRSGPAPSLGTPAPVRAALEPAIAAGVVHRVHASDSEEWFQMRDDVRSAFLRTPRHEEVHTAFADVLSQNEIMAYVGLSAEKDADLIWDLVERATRHRLEARMFAEQSNATGAASETIRGWHGGARSSAARVSVGC